MVPQHLELEGRRGSSRPYAVGSACHQGRASGSRRLPSARRRRPHGTAVLRQRVEQSATLESAPYCRLLQGRLQRSSRSSGHDGCESCAMRHQGRSEEHTSELQSRLHLVCRLLLEKKKTHNMGFAYFQGYFFCRPQESLARKVPSRRLRYLLCLSMICSAVIAWCLIKITVL